MAALIPIDARPATMPSIVSLISLRNTARNCSHRTVGQILISGEVDKWLDPVFPSNDSSHRHEACYVFWVFQRRILFMHGKKCSDVMTKDLTCCVAKDTVNLAAQSMKAQDIGAVPVVD